MTRPKDNAFATTLSRFEDFLSDDKRVAGGAFYRVVAEGGSEMKISYAALRQFVLHHRQLGERIARFRCALKDLHP